MDNNIIMPEGLDSNSYLENYSVVIPKFLAEDPNFEGYKLLEIKEKSPENGCSDGIGQYNGCIAILQKNNDKPVEYFLKHFYPFDTTGSILDFLFQKMVKSSVKTGEVSLHCNIKKDVENWFVLSRSVASPQNGKSYEYSFHTQHITPKRDILEMVARNCSTTAREQAKYLDILKASKASGDSKGAVCVYDHNLFLSDIHNKAFNTGIRSAYDSKSKKSILKLAIIDTGTSILYPGLKERSLFSTFYTKGYEDFSSKNIIEVALNKVLLNKKSGLNIIASFDNAIIYLLEKLAVNFAKKMDISLQDNPRLFAYSSREAYFETYMKETTHKLEIYRERICARVISSLNDIYMEIGMAGYSPAEKREKHKDLKNARDSIDEYCKDVNMNLLISSISLPKAGCAEDSRIITPHNTSLLSNSMTATVDGSNSLSKGLVI